MFEKSRAKRIIKQGHCSSSRLNAKLTHCIVMELKGRETANAFLIEQLLCDRHVHSPDACSLIDAFHSEPVALNKMASRPEVFNRLIEYALDNPDNMDLTLKSIPQHQETAAVVRLMCGLINKHDIEHTKTLFQRYGSTLDENARKTISRAITPGYSKKLLEFMLNDDKKVSLQETLAQTGGAKSSTNVSQQTHKPTVTPRDFI